MHDRVFGIETEYALIYHPGRGEVDRPLNLALYNRFEAALRRRVRSLPNALSPMRAKLGRFLENGGTFHYEATLDDYEHGLIEMASPECRDPVTLLEYERAKDELVEELAEEVNRELAARGYTGHVAIGKNNVDSAGHSFGSHENYWVDDPLPPVTQRLWLLLWPLLWIVSAPVLALVLGVQVLLIVALFAALLGLTLALAILPRLGGSWPARMLQLARRAQAFLETEQIELARRLQPLVAPLHGLIALHTAVYNRIHFVRLRSALSGFLVTRTLYAGAGALVFDSGPLFRLSQRASFIRSLSRICIDGKRRPIFEMRELFFRPWTTFARRRRLQLMVGDANLCEWAALLRIGATALVIEAIEEAPDWSWPELRQPLRALRQVSEDPWLRTELELADGSRATALEIQRRYLAGVRRCLATRALEVAWKRQVLSCWEETLSLLEHDPDALADRVDWIAKRGLIEAVIPDEADWRAIEGRGTALLAPVPTQGLEERRLRTLAYEAWRADLRYHELGPRGGYRRLERQGRARRLSAAEAVARARTQPPRDTRAHGRGNAIRWAHERALSGAAAWHRVRVGKFGWRWFRDPLEPTES